MFAEPGIVCQFDGEVVCNITCQIFSETEYIRRKDLFLWNRLNFEIGLCDSLLKTPCVCVSVYQSKAAVVTHCVMLEGKTLQVLSVFVRRRMF